MGKSKKSGGGTKTAKTSSGKSRMSRARRALRRIKMKIARWERNQENPEKKPPKWEKEQHVRQYSRHNEWNTDGLKKHAEILQEIIDRGIKVRSR